MNKCFYVLWILSASLVEYEFVQSAVSNIKEYCTFDIFEPVCPNGEVVQVQHAMYGRMRVGRCLPTDFYIGCAVDVLHIADHKCSGRRTCHVTVPDPEMTEIMDCLEDTSLLTYLEASFLCVEVSLPQRKTCTRPEQVAASTKVTYLSSLVCKETSCGLHDSPWILTSKPGQQLQVFLLDFSWDNKSIARNPQASRTCVQNYGYILDIRTDDIITICGGTSREKLLYTSVSHSVQIVLDYPALEKHYFLIAYKAIGCPDFQTPPHTWQEIENGSLVIGCVSSDKTWKLLCVNNMWLGIVGNCTPPSTTTTVSANTDALPNKHEAKRGESFTLPLVEKNHVITFVLACVTLIVCCVVIVLGIYCTKRYEVRSLRVPTAKFSAVTHGNNTLPYRTVNSAILQNQENPPTYSAALPKNERPPPPPQRRQTSQQPNRNSDYLTPCGGDKGGEESVHYYILENLTDSGEREKMYQNIN